MSEGLKKVKSIFKSPGIAAVLRWSKGVHVKVVLICLLTVAATVASLCFTLATKGLVDGAVSSHYDVLVKYALMLVGIILLQHVLNALLSKAPILLLDEATSALDEKTEARLLENMSKMRDRTCIIVTHRRAALDICDYTLHIEEGTMS